MEEHFRGHLTHPFTFEHGIPNQPRTATEIQSHLTETIVHGQAVAITFDSTLVTKGFAQAFAQRQSGVLNGVVFVHMQIAMAGNFKVNHAMFRNLF